MAESKAAKAIVSGVLPSPAPAVKPVQVAEIRVLQPPQTAKMETNAARVTDEVLTLVKAVNG